MNLVSEWMTVEELREGVGGKVYLPGDPGYDAARQAWNLSVVQEPQLIVDAETAVDVQLAVRFARSNRLTVGVMATGHGMPRGCDGVLIRTARMNGVKIDPETAQARVQGGALVKDVLAAAQPHGLAMLSGSSPEVGVVGYTLGGGFGLMIRKHGLAIDRVVGARVVTPDGHLLNVNANENPDIFWAIRGGGGAFGVVVEMTLELVPQPTVFGGCTIYPAENVEAIVKAYAAWSATLPEEATSAIVLMNLPPMPSIPEPLRGRAVVAINGCLCGELEDSEATVAPMRALGTPILDMWGTFPYAASACIFNDPTEPMPSVGQGAMLRDFSDATIDRMLSAIGPVDKMPQVALQIRHVTGAMARVSHAETPIGSYRDANYLFYAVGVPNPFASAAAILGHSSAVLSAAGDSLLCLGPLNFIGEGRVNSNAVKGVYGSDEYARLQEIKRLVDPENTFCFASVGLTD